MKVSVLTDAVSPKYFFPIWYKYYSAIFGSDNLHVITHESEQGGFEAFSLGSLRTVADRYDDNLRLEVVQQRARELLEISDAVIRVDTDEMLVPDPAFHPTFQSFLASWSGDYATARGFDVFQATLDAPYDPGSPVLGLQRKLAFANSAMNKTCLIRRPVRWNRGFHCVDGQPELGRLILFHLKRLDIDWQARWNAHVASRIHDDPFIRNYYETPREKIEQFHTALSGRSCDTGDDAVYRSEFIDTWMATLKVNAETQTLDGEYIIEKCNIQIPQRFWGIV